MPPSLTILAGPNGAGKTRNSDFLFTNEYLPVVPIDLDLLFIHAIDNLPHSFYGAERRTNQIFDKLFHNYCVEAIEQRKNFCYECNFRKDQLKYVGLFEEAGYSLNLIYFTLKSLNQSRERVEFRLKNQRGKFVDDKSIEINFTQGLFNLDNYYHDFHRVLIIDNSQDDYANIGYNLNIQVDIQKDKTFCYNTNFPIKELRVYIPNIAHLIDKTLNFQNTIEIVKPKINRGFSI